MEAEFARTPEAWRDPEPTRRRAGFSLVEVLIALLLGSVLVAGLSGVTSLALTAVETVSEREVLLRNGRFAMEQMVRMIGESPQLLVPMNDDSETNWPENVREQTEPPSAPIGDSTLATAVLAVAAPASLDLDGDKISDADDDRDGLIDEDLYNDIHNDSAPGIFGIDDDGDGGIDQGLLWFSDDESISADDDAINGLDDDGDNNIDEDPPADMNDDGCPGLCGVDDDGDGQVDEGSSSDDDEDGESDEDGFNPVVFYFASGSLWQRTPVPWDENGVGGITGRDFVANVIAENVTRFRVERLPAGYGDPQLVDITIELTGPETGERVELQTRVRLGGAL